MALGFPDVCLTPTPAGPVPIPYPNITDHSMAAGTVTNVRINMMDAFNMMTQIPMSTGDEAGASHPSIKGTQRYTMGMPNIRLNMMPAITLASLTNHNQMNCPIGAVLVPSAINVRLNRAAPSGSAGVERAARHVTVLCAGGTADVAAAVTDSGMARSSSGEGAVGRITVTSVSLAFATELAEAVHSALQEGAVGIAIDLTGCPGGVLSAAVDAASLFTAVGQHLVTVVDEDGDSHPQRSRGGPFLEVPLVLEVGPGTASAAEVFAGSLAACGRAVLRGSKTAGKGSIAEMVSLGDGRFVKVERGATHLPDGRAIAGLGLTPRFDEP